jgi:hypothetical protein
MCNRDFRPASAHTVLKPDPVMPCSAAAGVTDHVNDIANALKVLDITGVLPQRVSDLGLLDDRIDAPQPVRFSVGHRVKAMQRVIEIIQRLAVGPAALCFFCGQDRIVDRLFGIVAKAEVKCQ